MKVLIAKIPFSADAENLFENEAVVRLDRHCNGLIARAAHSGLFKDRNKGAKASTSRKSIAKDLLWLLPEYSEFKEVFVWLSKAHFPFEKVQTYLEGHSDSEVEIFCAGKLNQTELNKAKNIWPKLKPIDEVLLQEKR